VAEAGAPGAVTICTNMAGRGTASNSAATLKAAEEGIGRINDPELHAARVRRSHEELAAAHEKVKHAAGCSSSARNATRAGASTIGCGGRLRRAGRSGALALLPVAEDDLMRIFGSDRMGGMLQRWA